MARIKKQTAPTSKAIRRNIIWRIAMYIRLSREDGNDESDSVVNQKKILKEYLEQFFDGQYEIAGFYVDDGLTGTDDTRKDFMRMIQDIEQGLVSCVVCKTLSRAFRNYSDQGYYLEYYFPQKNVRFISTGDPKIDTFTNPEAITGLEVPITGLMNDRFAARTSSDIRRTFATKRRNGEFIGAFPPYGYLKDPQDKNRLILDPETVPVKRDIYRWLVHEGMSLNGTAKKLNELAIPNPTAYKRSKGWNYSNPHAKDNDGLWVGSTIRRMILEQVNLGHMVQGRQRVVSYKVHDTVAVPEDEWFVKHNTHEPTFTQEEYDNLARLLQRDTRTPNGERNVHLFAGFLKCHDCGKAMRRKPSKGYVYYVCRTYAEKSQTRCTRHGIREDELVNLVLSAVQAQITLLDSIAGIADEVNQSPEADAQSQRIEKLLAETHRELEKTQNLYDGLYADWRTEHITQAAYQRMKAKCEVKEAQLCEAVEQLKKEQHNLTKNITSQSAAFTTFLKYKNVQQLDRALLTELVDTIHIYEGKEITVCFRFEDELRRITKFAQAKKAIEQAA